MDNDKLMEYANLVEYKIEKHAEKHSWLKLEGWSVYGDESRKILKMVVYLTQGGILSLRIYHNGKCSLQLEHWAKSNMAQDSSLENVSIAEIVTSLEVEMGTAQKLKSAYDKQEL